MVAPSTSGAVNYTISAYLIIATALRKLGVIQDDEVPAASMTDTAMLALNAMVTGWQATGIRVWTQEEAILFTQPGQARYLFGPGTTDKACLFSDLVQSTLSASAAAAATTVQVTSIVGLVTGMQFGVQMDDGTNFWTTISGTPSGSTVTLAAALPSPATSGQITFAYASELLRPLRVPQGRRYLYYSQIQNTLITLSRLDYGNLSNLYSRGQPNQFFYDPQMGNGAYAAGQGVMNLWPVPSDNTVGIRFVSQRPLQYFATLADVPDFPPEWTAALFWNLAEELAPEYDVPPERFAMIEKAAATWFLRCSSWDKEPEPIFFGMAMSPGYR